MEKTKSKSFHLTMRSLHRDAGYLIFGFVIIYALSGIILMYRDTDLLKHEVTVEKKLPPNLKNEEIAGELRLRELQVIKTEGETVIFQNGSYNTASGLAVYTQKEIIFPFNKFINLHKTISSKNNHWFMIVFGVLLLFMAISSLWMFKTGTKFFRRGMLFVGAGIVCAILLLFL